MSVAVVVFIMQLKDEIVKRLVKSNKQEKCNEQPQQRNEHETFHEDVNVNANNRQSKKYTFL